MSQSTVAVASYFRGSQTWIAWIWMESKWKLQPEQSHSDETSPQWLNCTQPNIIDETDFKSLHFYHSIANQHPVLNILTHVDTFTDICTGSPSSKIHVRSTVNSITLHTRGNFFIFCSFLSKCAVILDSCFCVSSHSHEVFISFFISLVVTSLQLHEFYLNPRNSENGLL